MGGCNCKNSGWYLALAAFAKRWWVFISTLFDPYVLLLLVVSALIFYVTQQETNRIVINGATVVLSILTAIVGAIAYDRWSGFHKSDILKASGRTAIRTLRHLYESIFYMEDRIKKDRRELPEKDDFKLVAARLEDLAEKCKGLQGVVMNSIQTWSDVLQDPNVRTEIEGLAAQKLDIESKEEEVAKLNLKVKTEMQQKEGLEKKLVEKSVELEKLKFDYNQRESVLATTLSGTSSYVGNALLNIGFPPSSKQHYYTGARSTARQATGQVGTYCSECGKPFAFPEDKRHVPEILEIHLCPDCAKKKPS